MAARWQAGESGNAEEPLVLPLADLLDTNDCKLHNFVKRSALHVCGQAYTFSFLQGLIASQRDLAIWQQLLII